MTKDDPNWFIRTRLKTRQLVLLVALDEQRNIHRAADMLNMTQPAASKQLKDLEEMFDAPLFERLPRGMRPTAYGEAVIRHARTALTSLSRAYDEVAALKAGLSGQTDVGVITAASMTLLPRAIALVKRRSPTLRIGIQVESSNVLLQRLRQGTLDFLVARIPEQNDQPNLQYETLAEEPVSIVVRMGHPFLRNADLTLTDLAAAGWVLAPPGSAQRTCFDMMFVRNGLEPPSNVVETTAVQTATGLLQQTDFLHLMPTDVARCCAQHEIVAILPIELACRMEPFGIVTQRDRLLSPGAQILLQAVRQIAGRIYPAPQRLDRHQIPDSAQSH